MPRPTNAISTLIASIVLVVSAAPPASDAAPPDTGSTTRSTYTSQACVDQLRQLEQENQLTLDESICSAVVEISESPVQVATVDEARELARQDGLDARETSALLTQAAAGAIMYRNWTHTYWGGSVVEKHTGRTYWNGSKAWIAGYLGYAGSHTCHTEGSFAVGWSVKVVSCSRPVAGSSADAVYRFDASVGVQGSPVSLSIGLHYSTTANGTSSGWQVGG